MQAGLGPQQIFIVRRCGCGRGRPRQAKAGSGAAEAKIGCPPSLHFAAHLPWTWTCPDPPTPAPSSA
ncbi:hypothetical protein COCVIDRAFT_105749 [Bipolaris victoriae FI3]|uniref:Uncharacterized protein n=1 Tax=Bipolaris victoriae (strain FI3) TaxID=930091 RepID=W7EFV6_BIPV3|nr:hypothetical protein COCVIDRAFT_105749 [Bipolaris victoriae FI3]